MTDFVLEQVKLLKTQENNILQFRNNITNYANFLKQPLILGMFIPTDENGNVLEEPDLSLYEDYENRNEYDKQYQQYQQAKYRVIFEGFELINDELINNGILFWVGKFDGNETIENCIASNLTITETAVKKYGL